MSHKKKHGHCHTFSSDSDISHHKINNEGPPPPYLKTWRGKNRIIDSTSLLNHENPEDMATLDPPSFHSYPPFPHIQLSTYEQWNCQQWRSLGPPVIQILHQGS